MFLDWLVTLQHPKLREAEHSRNKTTVFDLISEHTLISGHPPHPPNFVLVKTIARAHRDLCVLAV